MIPRYLLAAERVLATALSFGPIAAEIIAYNGGRLSRRLAQETSCDQATFL
jgi:hypothetical protein